MVISGLIRDVFYNLIRGTAHALDREGSGRIVMPYELRLGN